MRKFVLIAAMVLASASAQAGQPRSLTLAANDEPAAAATDQAVEPAKPVEAAKSVETPKADDAPKFVERPAVVSPAAAVPPKADAAKPTVAAKEPTKADKPRHKHYWTEARIIGELHRHGVYW
jgi:hypothetical protein